MIFGLGEPVIFPTKSVEKLFEKLAAIDMFHAPHAGDEAFNVTFAVSAKFVGGAIAVVAGAFAGNDEAGIDDGADERDAFINGLFVLFFGMEREAELAEKKFANDFDITEKLGAAAFRNDDEKVVDVAAIMLIAEVEAHETVELVEKDVGKELRGEITNDNTAAFGLGEKTFGFW